MRKPVLSLPAALILLIFAAVMLGCSIDGPSYYRGFAPGGATVTGTVRDPITETALAQVRVSLGGASTLSDAQGGYRLEAVLDGAQLLTAHKDGYADYAASVLLRSGPNSCDINLLIPLAGSAFPATTPAWQIADFKGSCPLLANWSLASDPNYKFYRNRTPLAARVGVGAPRAPGVVPYIGFSTTLTPIAMDLGRNEASDLNLIHNFSHWDRIERFVYFGGSIGEGEILAPAPGWIKAAHQNGVPILGSIFFNEGNVEQTAWVRDSLSRSEVRQPIAAQLAAIAKAYGFDGYFINQEATQSTTLNAAFGLFIQDLHQAGTAIGYPLTVTWYQVAADVFVPETLVLGGRQNADYVFLDYGWDPYVFSDFTKDFPEVRAATLEPGINIARNQESPASFTGKLPLDKGPAGLFAFSTINAGAVGLGAVDNKHSLYFQGLGGFTSLRSPHRALPFLTFFNTGHGEQYFADGVCVRYERWNDIGQQDPLPGYRLLNGQDNYFNYRNDFYYSDAFCGGSCLRLRGTDTQATLRLFETDLALTATDQLSVALRAEDGSGAGAPWEIQLDLAKGGATSVQRFVLPATASWKQLDFDLGAFQGQRVTGISILTGKDGHLLLGKLFLGTAAAPGLVTGLSTSTQPKGTWFGTTLVWTGAGNLAYEIYDGAIFLGRTQQNAFAAFTDHRPSQLRVVPISRTGNR
jgi:mannosyl-glycoprotein endo-beta-N-acetylglucosaminidase